MATRRGSGDLDDLKAKLGVTGGSEAVSAPDSTTDSGATETDLALNPATS